MSTRVAWHLFSALRNSASASPRTRRMVWEAIASYRARLLIEGARHA